MKRLGIFLVVMIVSYSIYYDLKAGTLPSAAEPAVPAAMIEPVQEQEETVSDEIEIEYVEVKVKSGDTILSLMDQSLDGPLPVSIDQLIEDFQFLNEGESPQDIQAGEVYKLPLY
ncbi:hypothetical protein FZC84_04520 [Rossellomorea vietnamensis]|uniref:LysM domain-containing protein n=1 Tax=Rossellomorea vietnamensis TaxID=218284 RepID=A0A5D4MHH8_9BACI|nr:MULTISPECIES: hypothetical protein [Bacillaceae]TYS00764.1 hypothetical protein FZC84_04520 [Rossellomorea vietnamensis]